MRPLLACAAAALLAGCLAGDPAPPPAADPTPGGAPIPWELRGCRYFVLDVPVPAERLQARMPEGFTVSGTASPLSPATGEGPLFGIETFVCDEGTGLANETVAPIAWASFYTFADPPADLLIEDHLHFVMWDTLVPDAPRREALAARGLPVHAGESAIEEGPAAAPRIVATFSMEGLGAFRMEGAVAQDGTPFAGDFVEYMEGDGGRVAAWRTHFEASTARSGRAVVEVPAGSWVADVLGGERAVGSFITGEWRFTDGAIALPPRN